VPKPKIVPFEPSHLDEVVELSIRAWAPVFPLMAEDIERYVYDAFYPKGWEARQRADIAAACRDESVTTYVAIVGDKIAGYVSLRVHNEDSMGEVYILGVDPAFQRQGIGRALLDVAFEWFKGKGLTMAMVETGGDRGHAPSRATYEAAGFDRYPVARYFRKL
jgi:GNAT superfamily N-acetyltransferase